MGIALNTGSGGTGHPTAKLRDVNDWCDLAVVDIDTQAPAYVYGSNPLERALTKDGRPKTQDKVTALVVNPGSAVVTVDGVDRVLEVGEVVTVWFEGRDRWDGDEDKAREKGSMKSWRGAQEDHGQVMVGDIFRWQFTGTKQGAGAQPRKLRLVVMRSPRPEEQSIKERCEQLYREKDSIAVGASAAPAAGPEPF